MSSAVLRQQPRGRLTAADGTPQTVGLTAFAGCGTPRRGGSGRGARLGALSLNVNKERDNEAHRRGEADFDRLMSPMDRMRCCQAFVGRRSGDRLGKLPSAGAVKMGTLTLRCVYSAYGRSHREKPV
jgi:hypothetical protein